MATNLQEVSTVTSTAAEPPAYASVDSQFGRVHTPHEAHWLSVARQVSAEFAKSATESYLQRKHPREEIQRLKTTGLTTLLIPEEHGGGGGDWRLVVEVIREIAAGNGSLGVLLTHHYFGIQGLAHLAEPGRSAAYKEAVRLKRFRGVIANPRDPDIIATPLGNGKFALNGRKTYCTGAAVADQIGAQVRRADTKQLALATLIPPVPGLTPGNDWDAVGLPMADSGSFTLENVIVDEANLLPFGNPVEEGVIPEANLGPLGVPSGNLAFSNVYLGIAIGALRAAREYIQTTTRPWIVSGVEHAADDPHIVYLFGELWAELEAALAVANLAAERVQYITALAPEDLSEELRGDVRVAVATLKVLATRASVNISSKIFELTGARSSASRYGFDRFWRDARTYTLHSPVFYKVRELGNYGLNGKYPPDTFYT